MCKKSKLGKRIIFCKHRTTYVLPLEKYLLIMVIYIKVLRVRSELHRNQYILFYEVSTRAVFCLFFVFWVTVLDPVRRTVDAYDNSLLS